LAIRTWTEKAGLYIHSPSWATYCLGDMDINVNWSNAT
jgi:hypothetical protein